MAKQISDNIITGNIDNLVFYKMDGIGYVRRKSSLTGKQFKTQQRFANSRKSNERFAMGNKVASKIYHAIPEGERTYSLFTKLRSTAIALLKSDLPENDVGAQLIQLIPTPKH